MKRYDHAGHAPSLLPEDKAWMLVWNDEFDGTTLDTSKWGFRRNFWGKPFPAFTDEGVELDGQSHLRLHLLRKGDEFCSPHLQTGSLTYDIPKNKEGIWPFGSYQKPKFMHRFGYYEIRCRMPKCDGWHAAFWLQAPSIGASPDPRYCGVECDIMESYKLFSSGEIICGNIWNGYGADCKGNGHFHFPFVETADGWHTYGVDWSREGYVFYADGAEVGRVAGPISEVEQFILVSTECHGYRGPGFTAPAGHQPGTPCSLLKNAVLPDYFEVDFVRVFDAV